MLCHVQLHYIVSFLLMFCSLVDQPSIFITQLTVWSRISVLYFVCCRIAFHIHFFFSNQSINFPTNQPINQTTNKSLPVSLLSSQPSPLQRYAADAAVRYGYAESKGLDLPELCARATKHNLDAEVICNSIPSSINLGMLCVVILSILYSTLFYTTLLYSTLLYSTLLYSTPLYITLIYTSLLFISFNIYST